MKSFFKFNNILESCFVNNQNFQVVKNMAKLIIQYKKELTAGNVYDLFYYATNRQQMARILNQHHNRKTPEIQKLINKYL